MSVCLLSGTSFRYDRALDRAMDRTCNGHDLFYYTVHVLCVEIKVIGSQWDPMDPIMWDHA
jgi:hypothetical protein